MTMENRILNGLDSDNATALATALAMALAMALATAPAMAPL